MKGSMILLLLVAFLCACFTHGREHETQKLNHVWSNAMSTSFSAAEVSEAGNAIPSVFGLQGIPEKLIAVHLQEQIKQNVLGHSEYVEVLRRLIVEHTLARPHIYVTTESVDSLVSFMAELLDLHVPVHVHYYSPATHGAADKPVSGHHWKLPNTTHEHTSGLVVNGHHAPQQDRSKSHTIKHSLVALLLTMEASYYITPRREHNVRSRLIHELRREVVDVDCGNCTEGFEVKTNHHAVENSTVHEAPSDKMDFSFDPVDRSEEFRLLRGDNTGLRVLIVSVDNRHLAQDYLPLTAVLRYNYCKQHGYGYVSVRDDTVASLRGLKERYAEYVKLDEATFGQSKYGHSNFHPGLKQFRSSAFAKVPSLWYLHQRYGAYFDYIMFQDSDAAPNPTQENRSVGDALNEWSASNTSVMRGVADPREADFIFFNNFPWRDDLPCTGTFLLKSSEHAEVVLREWWDYDLPQKNFVDFMEQDPLWYSLEAPPEMKFEMNFHRTATLLNEKQIPSKWYSINDLWLVHVPNYEPNRFAYFRTM